MTDDRLTDPQRRLLLQAAASLALVPAAASAATAGKPADTREDKRGG